MNLDPLSFALAQISSLIAGLNKKNYKSSVAELHALVAEHGFEAERYFIRCLFSAVDFASDGRQGSKDYHQLQLLIQECHLQDRLNPSASGTPPASSQPTTGVLLFSGPNFPHLLQYAIENPLNHQKSLRPSKELLSNISSHLKLSRFQEVILSLALLQSKPELSSLVPAFLKDKLEKLDESELKDTTQDQLNFFFSTIVTCQKALKLSSETVNKFIGWGANSSTLGPLGQAFAGLRLGSDVVGGDVGRLVASQNSVFSKSTASESLSFGDYVMEVGPSVSRSVEDFQMFLEKVPSQLVTPNACALLLAKIVRAIKPGGASASLGPIQTTNPGDEANDFDVWHVQNVMQALRTQLSNFNWLECMRTLDNEFFTIPHRDALQVLVRGLQVALNDTHLPADVFCKTNWQHTQGQLEFIIQSLQNPDVFSFATAGLLMIPIEQLKLPHGSYEDRELKTWRCWELVNVLLHLASLGHEPEVRNLFQRPRERCPEILSLSLLAAPRWDYLKQDILVDLIQTFLDRHPTSGPIWHQLQAQQESNDQLRLCILRAMTEWYDRSPDGGDGIESLNRMSRILDVAHELKAVLALLNFRPFNFVIELACLAYRREFLNLYKWLPQKLTEHGQEFFAECLSYLERRFPYLIDPNANTPAEYWQMKAGEVIQPLLTSLQRYMVSSEAGPLPSKLTEKLLLMAGNNRQMLARAQQQQQQEQAQVQQRQQAVSVTTIQQSPAVGAPNAGRPSSPPMISGIPASRLPSGQIGIPGSGGRIVSVTPPLLQGTPAGTPSQPGAPGQPQQQPGQFPEHFDSSIEAEANSYFQKIFGFSGQNSMEFNDMVEMLRRLHDSPTRRDQEVFICMVKNLLDEFRYYDRYPPRELGIAATLYGCLIAESLLPPQPLVMAMRIILESLKSDNTRLHEFAIRALEQFRHKLKDYSRFCTAILEMAHANQINIRVLPLHLIQLIYYGAGKPFPGDQQLAAPDSGPMGGPGGMQQSQQANPQAAVLQQVVQAQLQAQQRQQQAQQAQVQQNQAHAAAFFDAVAGGATAVGGAQTPLQLQAMAATAVSVAAINKSAAASSTPVPSPAPAQPAPPPPPPPVEEPVIQKPPDQVVERVSFIVNNLSQSNLDDKLVDFRRVVQDEHMPWVASYLVTKRVPLEINFHNLYLQFVESLNQISLIELMIKETLRNIRVLLKAPKSEGALSDRKLLKNLGHWLGLLTLHRNRPIAYNEIDLKALLFEAYHRGGPELYYVVCFVVKVLEGTAKSRLFKYPSPIASAVLKVLVELNNDPNSKLYLKFEVEVLCKQLGIDLRQIQQTVSNMYGHRPFFTDQHYMEYILGQEPQLSNAPLFPQTVPTPLMPQMSGPPVSQNQQQAGQMAQATSASSGAALAAAQIAALQQQQRMPNSGQQLQQGQQPPSSVASIGSRGATPAVSQAALMSAIAGGGFTQTQSNAHMAQMHAAQQQTNQQQPVPVSLQQLQQAASSASQPSNQAQQQQQQQQQQQGQGGQGGQQAPPAQAGAQPAQQQQQQLFDYRTVSLEKDLVDSGLLQFNEQLPPIAGSPMVVMALKRNLDAAAKESIQSGMDRILKHTLATCEALVKKDFALDPEEHHLRQAAGYLIKQLVCGTTLVQLKDMIASNMLTRVRAILSSDGVRRDFTSEQLDECARRIVDDSLPAVLAFVQAKTMEFAAAEMEKHLGPEYEVRRLARNEGRHYCSHQTLQYQAERMPEPLRLKVGSVLPHQIAAYEELLRNMPGFQPMTAPSIGIEPVPSPSLPTGTQNQPPTRGHGGGPHGAIGHPPTSTSPALDEAQLLIESLRNDVQQAFQNMYIAGILGSSEAQQTRQVKLLMELMDWLQKARATEVSPDQLVVKIFESFFEGYRAPVVPLQTTIGLDHPLLSRFRDVHLYALAKLQQLTMFGPGWLSQKVTKAWMECREEIRYNVDAFVCVLKAGLFLVQVLDGQMAQSLESAATMLSPAVLNLLGFIAMFLQAFCLAEDGPALVTIQNTFHEAEFARTIDALRRLLPHIHNPQVAESLQQVVNNLAIQSEYCVVLPDRPFIVPPGGSQPTPLPAGATATSQPFEMMMNGVAAARDVNEDPPGLREKTESLLRTWVELCHTQPKDVGRLFHGYIQQMIKMGVLQSDDVVTRFFRHGVEIAVEHAYESLSESSLNATQQRARAFHVTDAFVKLIVTVLKNTSGGDQAAHSRISLLNKVLGLIVGVTLRDQERRQENFHPLPYHRLLIQLWTEIVVNDSSVAEAWMQYIIAAFSNALHYLRPTKAPSFVFSWLDIVAHRYFLGKVLTYSPPNAGRRCWLYFSQLLADLFRFFAPFLRNMEITKSMHVLYKGTLRILLVVLHDFPEFLCTFCPLFCDIIPLNCIQLRNVILSAYPKSMRLQDPFSPSLDLSQIREMNQLPQIYGDPAVVLPAALKRDLDAFIETGQAVDVLNNIEGFLRVENDPSNRYNVPMINALVLYVGSHAIRCLRDEGREISITEVYRQRHMNIFLSMAIHFNTEARYLYLSAMTNQLRYPNSHTAYFHCVLLNLFAETGRADVEDQIVRVFLERLIVSRPHPWGLLVTFTELFKRPHYRLWDKLFVTSSPDFEKLFKSLASSCMQSTPAVGSSGLGSGGQSAVVAPGGTQQQPNVGGLLQTQPGAQQTTRR